VCVCVLTVVVEIGCCNHVGGPLEDLGVLSDTTPTGSARRRDSVMKYQRLFLHAEYTMQ